jgi:hypothetical protein
LFFGDHQTIAQNWIRSRQSFVGTTGVRGFLNYTMILFIALTLTPMAEKKEAGGSERKFRFAYKRGGERDPLMTFHFMSGVFSSLAHSRPF